MNKWYLIGCMSVAVVACGEATSGNNASSPAKSPVEKALDTGNALLVDDPNQFIQASRHVVAEEKLSSKALKTTLAQGDLTLHWNPTHDAAIFASNFGFNTDVLITNQNMSNGNPADEFSIGVAGKSSSGTRYLALGSNPFRTAKSDASNVNADMHTWLLNGLTWLTGKADLTDSKIVIAHMDQSYWFPDEVATREWLQQKAGVNTSINEQNVCDAEKLIACLQEKPDLLILSQAGGNDSNMADAMAGLSYALDNQIPVFYLHWDGGLEDLGRNILSKLNIRYVRDNYWSRYGVADWKPASIIDRSPSTIEAQQALFHRLENDAFTVDLSLCKDKSCEEASKMDEEFYQAAVNLRDHLTWLDKKGVRLFEVDGYKYEKLVILLADSYRQSATFPMDKEKTTTIDFLRSYFADHIQYHSREMNPKQLDMGNFSRSDFPNKVGRVKKTVQMESKRNFRSAGVYAFPGETFVVRRLDSSAVKTEVALNSLRSGATHEFNKDGYTRPKYLTSTRYAIAKGETLRLTSAYGGPIHIHFDTNDLPVELKFEKVGEHPVWRSSADNETFVKQLEANQFDWAELITPGFEVHSKLDKMLISVNDENWAVPADMALATERYMHNLPHALAGFVGPGIEEIEEIHTYARNQGWEINTIDVVKHMNADQATCGYGCSGNPYDAYWAYNPLGHGDLHELGHGLEKGRFRFDGWEGHATTNYYSYYSKSQFFKDTGKESQCQSLGFKEHFDLLQKDVVSDLAEDSMANQNQKSWSWGARVIIQTMMATQYEKVLNNGWHLLGRLHILEREFGRAIASDEQWAARKDKIGFGTLTREQARNLGKNDWLLIALSRVSERDLREYLTMWGLSFTDLGKTQVAAMNLTTMPKRFFASSAKGYCTTDFARYPVDIDGTSAWPLN